MTGPILPSHYSGSAHSISESARATNVFPTHRRMWLFAPTLCLLSFCPINVALSQPMSLRQGEDFRRGWEEEPFSATWQGIGARDALDRLTRERRLATWLDRRIDPGLPLDVVLPEDTLQVACQRLASRLDAGVCRIDSLLYFGPRELVRRLPTVAALRRADLEKIMGDRRRALLTPKSMEWDALAEPRALVTRLAEEAGMTVRDLERRVPHDLWPAQRLPPLVWADRVSIVLASLDLTFELSAEGNELILHALPEAPVFERSVAPKGAATRVAAELAEKFPQVQTQAMGNKLVLRGLFDDVEMAERLAKGQRLVRPQVREQPKTFTMKVDQQTAGRVLRYIAEQQRLKLEIADDAQAALEMPVSFSVENVSMLDLLAATLRGTGLRFELQDERVTVSR